MTEIPCRIQQPTPQVHPLASNNQALPVPRRIWFSREFPPVPDLLEIDRTVSGMSQESGRESVERRDSVLLKPGNGLVRSTRPSMTPLKTAGLYGTGCTSSKNDGS
jgi:hypothetical protein